MTDVLQLTHYDLDAKRCGDSRFFAAKEASLSAEGGDSPREQEKSRISVIKQYAIVQTRKRAG
ncbi:hypothetical protein CGSMWGv55152_05933 [Gardnerella vaginalis 55152]|uniref:Uncharacterized protein n=1 Tax=Gardnerella vaginalis 55152 TaxID=698955 RepID=I4LQN5_GARVA|nr:hypothetical protein CGSMWGv55152_05933 [Gardnerella vaginalis 55152]